MRVELEGRTPIKLWTTSPQGDVPVEEKALAQLRNIARMPFVFRHVAAMPDVHLELGPPSGRCSPPAGRSCRPPWGAVRSAVEQAVPHGRTNHGGAGDRGAWGEPPPAVAETWGVLGGDERYRLLVERHPKTGSGSCERS